MSRDKQKQSKTSGNTKPQPNGEELAMDALYASLFSQVDAFPNDMWTEAEYQGFDPMETLKTVIKYGDDANPKRSPDQVRKDMLNACVIGVRRGTNWMKESFSARSTTGLDEVVDDLINVYHIEPNLADTSRGPEIVTVARIMVTFNEVVAALYETRGSPLGSVEGLPKALSFPAAASLMNDEEWTKLQEPFLRGMVKFSKTVNAKNKDKKRMSDLEIKEEQRNFAEISRNSKFSKVLLKRKRTYYNTLIEAWSENPKEAFKFA